MVFMPDHNQRRIREMLGRGTNVRKVIAESTAIEAHFRDIGQFIGLAGSWSAGSSHHTSNGSMGSFAASFVTSSSLLVLGGVFCMVSLVSTVGESDFPTSRSFSFSGG